jgi:voltage-dependent calcium channel L type alpha-1D
MLLAVLTLTLTSTPCTLRRCVCTQQQGVNYFKGALMSCQGDVFNSLSADQQAFITHPAAWNSTSAAQQAWFDTSSCRSDPPFTVGTTVAPMPCCASWPSDAWTTPTSRDVCACVGADWSETIPQQFNNVVQASLSLFEISTTESWVDVMYACIDSVGINAQPVRDHNMKVAWLFIL